VSDLFPESTDDDVIDSNDDDDDEDDELEPDGTGDELDLDE
jgi:hypothetical protein